MAEWAAVVSAALSALAAGAAWLNVVTERRRQSAQRWPTVSAGYQSRSHGPHSIEFVNAGPGLAIQLGYFVVGGSRKQGGIVGGGHLRAGEGAVVPLTFAAPGKTSTFIWLCRDVDQRLHLWSYDGRHEHLKVGDYPKLGDAFRRMYPDVPVPPSAGG